MANSIKGLTIAIEADTKKFLSGMKSMDRQIKQTQNEVGSLANSLKLEWDSKRFEQAMKLSQDALQKTNDKAQQLKNKLKELDEQGVDQNTLGYQKIQSELVLTESKAVSLNAELQKLKDLHIEELASKFETIGSSITSVGNALTPVSAAAAALLTTMAAIGNSTVEFGDYIGTTAQQLNISSEELQKWLYIGQQTDVEQSQLVAGLVKVQAALAELAAGEITPASQALMNLGITSEQAALGMSANFETLLLSLSNVSDETKQVTIANDIFEKRFASKLIPLLNDGGAGLAALSSEWKKFNYLTNDEVSALDSFDDVMDRIKYQFVTIRNEIGIALLPLMQKLSNFIENTAIPAVQKIADAFSSLSESQKETIVKVLAITTALAPILLIIGKLTSGIGSVITSVGSLSKVLTLLSAHPIIAAIGAVVLIMGYLYTKNEEFRNSINELFSALGSVLLPIMEILKTELSVLFNMLTPIINILAKILVPIIEKMTQALIPLGQAIEWISDKYEQLGNIVTKFFEDLPNIIVKVVDYVDIVINKVIGFINKIIDGINSVGEVLGFQLDQLDEVDLSAKVETYVNNGQSNIEAQNTTSTQTSDVIADKVISNSTSTVTQNVITNTDNSSKSVTIENVNLYNYGAELNLDDLKTQLNLIFAKEM